MRFEKAKNGDLLQKADRHASCPIGDDSL